MASRIDRLAVGALVYLCLPVPIFLLGWLEPAPGLLLTALYGWALRELLRELPAAELPHPAASSFVWLALLGLVWAALGGAGHLVFANLDWRTRDAVYADLILGAWPPSYGTIQGDPLVLRSAIAFFLPAAAGAKLAGLGAAAALLLAWSAIGGILFLWLLPLPGRFGMRLIALSLATVLFSGMDYAAILAIHGTTPLFPLPLEWWRPWTYTSLSAQLFWAPNHALPLWIGCLLLHRLRGSAKLPALCVVLLPTLLLWTPFAVGLLPWALWALWQENAPLAQQLRRPSPVQWLSAALATLLLLAYFTRPGIEATEVSLTAAGIQSGGSGSAWSRIDMALAYIQFAAFEFGILVLLLRPADRAGRQALLLATTLLLCLPLLRIGPSNDWMLRISTPCLVILLVLTLHELNRPLGELMRTPRRAALLTVIALGTITPGFEIARALFWPRTPPNYGHTLVEQQGGYMPPHYIGRLNLSPLRQVFKEPQRVPAGSARVLP